MSRLNEENELKGALWNTSNGEKTGHSEDVGILPKAYLIPLFWLPDSCLRMGFCCLGAMNSGTRTALLANSLWRGFALCSLTLCSIDSYRIYLFWSFSVWYPSHLPFNIDLSPDPWCLVLPWKSLWVLCLVTLPTAVTGEFTPDSNRQWTHKSFIAEKV